MKQLDEQINLLQKGNIYTIFQENTVKVDDHNKLVLPRARYNEFSASRAAAKVLKLKQNFYEHGDKAGRLLAWQIKQRQTERTITEIEGPLGNIVDPIKINEAFRDYYKKLYSFVSSQSGAPVTVLRQP